MHQYFTVLFAFLINGLVIGPAKCLNLFFIQYQLNLNASAWDASTVSSFFYAAMFLSGKWILHILFLREPENSIQNIFNSSEGPVTTILVNKFGYRCTLILGTSLAGLGCILCSFAANMAMVDATAGILFGMIILGLSVYNSTVYYFYFSFVNLGTGCGLTNMPSLAFVSQKFEVKRSLANNIVTTGSALISIPLSPLIQYFIYYYGWRGANLLLGGMILNGIPLSLLLITRKTNSNIAQSRKLIDMDLLKTLSFPLYAIGTAFHVASAIIVSIYLVRYAQEQGIGDYEAATLASAYSFMDLALRPLSGYLTSLSHIGCIPIRRSYCFAGLLCYRAVVAGMFPFATDFSGIFIATLAFAVSSILIPYIRCAS